jgi:hypothetical protein
MNKDLLKQLTEIESRGNYLEMSDVLIANVNHAKSDPQYAIYAMKCVAKGGLNKGNNRFVMVGLKMTASSENSGGMFDRLVAKKSNNVIDIGKENMVKLTNSYFLQAIDTVITYGDDIMIDSANSIMKPLYESISRMLKHKATMNYTTYNAIASVICPIGNKIADNIIGSSKSELPGAKAMVESFVLSIMTPLKAFISGFLGLLNGSSIPTGTRRDVNATYKKMKALI